ncbi:Pentatricopeptide repeat-containing protein [Melia azedarach]|uniref:Pentatricopeptide repeat-containing protein n=1 Tax=Melia azedarach TaxID=155640 RepID=A0ACC1WVI5_MELAZ|nr:Pentatricopeptide repeat-containing protein [Melia azedarach]
MALISRLRIILNLNSIKHRSLSTSSVLSGPERISKEKKRAVLSLLRSESNPERILEICRAASLSPESNLDRIAFSIAISKLSQANHFNAIAQFLEELKTRPDLRQNERFIAHSIILYGQANMIDHAMRTFKEMEKRGLRHSVKSLNALLVACNLAEEYEEAKRIFLEFPKTYGIEPNLETYNRVIKAFSESGNSSSVYSILAEMDKKSIKPNTTSFGLLLAGFYKEDKYEDVGKVLQMMGKHGIESGVSVNNIRIQSLCKLKRSAEAKILFDGMLSRGTKPNLETYKHLIHGFCKEGNLKEAKNLFRTMIKRGYEPDSNFYFSFVYFLCQGGDYEAALKVCNESIEKGWVPPFSNMKSLVIGLASISKVAEAKKLVRLVKEKFPIDVDMWNEIETGLPKA